MRQRFLHLAQLLNVSKAEALEIFRKDFWVLSEPIESLVPKLRVMREENSQEEAAVAMKSIRNL